MPLDTAALQIFQAAARSGSVSKAAQLLNYAQSNVTTKIKQLEKELGAPLFYRHNRGITLTPAGKTLLEYADKALRLLEEARKAIQDASTPTGPLSIGSMETTAAVRLPHLLADYHRMCPEVDLSFVTGPSQQLIQAVLDYSLDGAFVMGPVEHPELLQDSVFEEELVLVTDALRPRLDFPKELTDRTVLVFRSGCSYRAKLLGWLQEEGVMPVKIMEFGTLETIIGCVAAGLGVSLLPESIVRSKTKESLVRSYPIPERYGKVQTVFIRRKDAYLTQAYKLFLHEINNRFRVPRGSGQPS
ncbi:LysR family transcriptional regulator [Paenibacillus tyrfis]|uniref:LysR family transcriptional regulator n=1 Tax=Paenibacillus tyrfis TaxID=1501230 RepID=UPI0035CD3B92